MARLPILENPDLGQDEDEFLNANYGVFKVLGHSQGAAKAFWKPVRYILHESGFDPRIRELVILTVAFVTRTTYAWAHHIRVSRRDGVPDSDIHALIRHLEGLETELDPTALAVINATRQLTETATISDEAFAGLEAAFDTAQLAELVLMMANYNSVIRVLNGLRVDLEPDFEVYLDEFPLPKAL